MWIWARVWKKKVSAITWRVGRGLLSSLSRVTSIRERRSPLGISRAERKLAAILSVATPVFAIFCLFFGWYVLPRYSNRWESPLATILLSSPRYFALNEEEEIRIAVKNEKDSSIQVNLRLEGSNTVLIFIEQSGTNIISAGEIRGNEQIERKVKILIPYDFGGGQANDTLRNPIGLVLRGNVEGQMVQQILPLSTIPVPWARRLFGVCFSMLAGVFAWVAKEWWDITKDASGKAT